MHEQGWDKEFKLGGIERFKQMLKMYFEQYTKGAVRNEVVETYGTLRALDAWRILADRGCSQRPEALHAKFAKRAQVAIAAERNPSAREHRSCSEI